MTDDTRQILLNRDVIALNQDDLVTQGRRVQLDGPKTQAARMFRGLGLALLMAHR